MLECFKVNVIGNVHLFNLYLPLVLRGQTKKIITLSTGMADMDLTRDYKLVLAAPYSISKVAANAATAKFHAQYADQGVLFLNICPGVVDTGVYDGGKEPLLDTTDSDSNSNSANFAVPYSDRRTDEARNGAGGRLHAVFAEFHWCEGSCGVGGEDAFDHQPGQFGGWLWWCFHLAPGQRREVGLRYH
jgi:NAD(P)-dependent dehydrogenase (short-subunit alcohol dehydrogenase family)